MVFSSWWFFQKTNKRIRFFCLTVLKTNLFVRFRKNLRIPKSPFEIKWPLLRTQKNELFVIVCPKRFEKLFGGKANVVPLASCFWNGSMGRLALVASSYPPIYGAIDSFRRLIITPILVLSAIPGLDRAIMGEKEEILWKPFLFLLSFFLGQLGSIIFKIVFDLFYMEVAYWYSRDFYLHHRCQ